MKTINQNIWIWSLLSLLFLVSCREDPIELTFYGRIEGEVTNEGSIFAAIVVADPGQDVLYGASYDAATKESKKYADKEGTEYPDVIGDWLSSYE